MSGSPRKNPLPARIEDFEPGPENWDQLLSDWNAKCVDLPEDEAVAMGLGSLLDMLDRQDPRFTRHPIAHGLARLHRDLIDRIAEKRRVKAGVNSGRPPLPARLAELRAAALGTVDALQKAGFGANTARKTVAEHLTAGGMRTTSGTVRMWSRDWSESQPQRGDANRTPVIAREARVWMAQVVIKAADELVREHGAIPHDAFLSAAESMIRSQMDRLVRVDERAGR